jgi:hypothetical protein
LSWSLMALTNDRQGETVSKSLSERRAWRDTLSPGNPAFRAGPDHYPASLRDDKALNPQGAMDSGSVLQRLSQNSMIRTNRVTLGGLEATGDCRKTLSEVQIVACLRPLHILTALTPALSQMERGHSWSSFTIPSPSGRGTQGEAGRATILLVPRILRQFL